LTNANGTLFFDVFESSHGTELWKSNGTSSGTALVQDIFPGSNSANPSGLTNVSGMLFFSANDGSHGQELWGLGAPLPAPPPRASPPVSLGSGRYLPASPPASPTGPPAGPSGLWLDTLPPVDPLAAALAGDAAFLALWPADDTLAIDLLLAERASRQRGGSPALWSSQYS
jgi:ELWxxDGT repeat protein